MHNFALTGFENASVMSNNMTVIDQALDSVTHRVWVGASSMDSMNSATFPTYHVGSSGVYGPRWNLPDGVTSEIGFYYPRNNDWIFGVLSLVVHYSASSTSGTIDWKVYITPITNLTVASGTVVNITGETSPTVANAITTKEFNTAAIAATSQVGREHVGVAVTIGRRGATDSNNGDVYIYGVELVYKEKRRMVGAKA